MKRFKSLLADEIKPRGLAKVQSALLEAMGERQGLQGATNTLTL